MAPARPTRVLVLTADTVGAAMAGPAIRAVELATQIRAQLGPDAVVTLGSPHPIDRALPGLTASTYRSERDLRALVADADVVVAMAGLLDEHRWIGDADPATGQRPAVVVDAYDPVLFEVLELFAADDRSTRVATAADARSRMVEPLRRADLVLVASDRQRHLVIGMLAALGRIGVDVYDLDPTLERFVAVVPFGLPNDPPDAQGRHPLKGDDGPFDPDDFVVLWGGGLHQWLDPVTLVDAIADIDDPRVKACFLAGAHPTPEVPAMAMAAQARARAEHHGLAGTRVVFADRWVPYDERAGWLLDADLSVSLAGRHLETTFAYRTRLLDSLWAALPIVCSDGDTLADLVQRQELGRVVPPGDPDALAAAIVSLRDPHCYADARRALQELAPSYTWARVAAPIVEFCRRPTISPDRIAHGPAPSRSAGARVTRSGQALARRGRELVRRGSAALAETRTPPQEQP